MLHRLQRISEWLNNNAAIVTVVAVVVVGGSLYAIITPGADGEGVTADGLPRFEWYYDPTTGDFYPGGSSASSLESPESMRLLARLVTCGEGDDAKVVDILLYRSSDGQSYDHVASVSDPTVWRPLAEFDAEASDPAEAVSAGHDALGNAPPSCDTRLVYSLPAELLDTLPTGVWDWKFARTKSGLFAARR